MKKNYFINIICKFLVNVFFGKAFGIGLVVLPSIILLLNFNYDSSWLLYLIVLILFSYIGLFLGGILHEFGHMITLRLYGCKSKLKIMLNDHSKIIFFNMKTIIINDHPLFSTKDKLLIRGISGMASNILFMVLFIFLGIKLDSNILLYLAVIQGFSAHGATPLSSMEGDTDIATIKKALNLDEKISVIREEKENVLDYTITFKLSQDNFVEDSYWIFLKNDSNNLKFTEKNLTRFKMNQGNIFIVSQINVMENYEIKITKSLEQNLGKFQMTTKCGNIINLT